MRMDWLQPMKLKFFKRCDCLTVILHIFICEKDVDQKEYSIFNPFIYSFDCKLPPGTIRSLFPFQELLEKKNLIQMRNIAFTASVTSIRRNIEVQEMLYHESHTYF